MGLQDIANVIAAETAVDRGPKALSKAKVQPLRIVEVGGISRDTVECLEALLERARRGEVIGVAYAAMYRRRRYTVHACGEADRNPTFARGMVAALADKLSKQVWGESD